MNKKIYLFLYVVLMILNMLDSIHLISIKVITKPLLMTILMIYVYHYKRENKNLNLLITALLFALLGDIFLIHLDIMSFFILGLGSFLVVHICYIVLFLKSFKKINQHCDKLMNLFRIIIILLSLVFYTVMYKYFGSLLIPSTLYMIVIMIMFLSGTFRNKNYHSNNYFSVVLGCTCFLLSDASLTISKFYSHFYLDELLIITTYMVAQMLIVFGLVTEKVKV